MSKSTPQAPQPADTPPSASAADAPMAAMAELQRVVDTLISPGGCPWDRDQTPHSLCDYIIEEAFELVEAVRADPSGTVSPKALEDAQAAPAPIGQEAARGEGARLEVMEELGDVLFLLLFITSLYERCGHFSLKDVAGAIAAKMVRRHPHVFEDLKVDTRDELLGNWERIKRGEKANNEDPSQAPGVFGSLPKGLPPLLRAYRINSKAARVGFTWDGDEAQEAQLADEWREWKEAEASGDEDRMREEFGDYLVTLVEYGRRRGIKANAALDFADTKFLRRFEAMEALARERGQDVPDLSLDEQNALWGEVKD